MSFQRMVTTLLAALVMPVLAFAQPAPSDDTRTTFTVYKLFSDGNNETPVTVHIQCFTGLPLNQQQTVVADNDGEFEVEFVVESFNQGELDCNIWEGEVAGYTATYDAGSYVGDSAADSDGCHFTNIDTSIDRGPAPPVLTFEENGCSITNDPDPVEVTVNKDWVIDGSGGNALDPAYALLLVCEDQIVDGEDCLNPTLQGGTKNGYYGSCYYYSNAWIKVLTEHGTGDTDDAQYTAEVIPDWDGGTDCWVEEEVYDSSVEVDGYDCGYSGNPGLHAEIGGEEGKYECTITNTVFYEGIPTLSQYGMMILALLMLGMGFVGFRRLV